MEIVSHHLGRGGRRPFRSSTSAGKGCVKCRPRRNVHHSRSGPEEGSVRVRASLLCRRSARRAAWDQRTAAAYAPRSLRFRSRRHQSPRRVDARALRSASGQCAAPLQSSQAKPPELSRITVAPHRGSQSRSRTHAESRDRPQDPVHASVLRHQFPAPSAHRYTRQPG